MMNLLLLLVALEAGGSNPLSHPRLTGSDPNPGRSRVALEQATSAPNHGARSALDPGEGPQFLAVSYRVSSQDFVSYTWVYETHEAARKDALKMAACGFWRADLVTRQEYLVLPGAIQEIAFMTPQEAPPVHAPEIPTPDIFAIAECRAGLRIR